MVTLVLVGGCSSTTPGTALPGAPTTGSGLPARTKDLPVRGVDPCTLLTPAQLDQLNENGAPRLVARESWRDGPTCAFGVDAVPPTYTYYLETITTYDLEDWRTGTHDKSNLTQQPASVPGFPALVEFAPSAGIQDCETLVGVAAGQTLRAETAPDDTSFTQQQLCDMATTVAKMAVETLETLK